MTRTLGPAKRAPEIPLPRDEGHAAWPCDRYEAWVFAARFILREQELACVFLNDVEVRAPQLQNTLNLPVSKGEPMGSGARRTLGCVTCLFNFTRRVPNLPLPFCVTLRLLRRQEQWLQVKGGSRSAEGFMVGELSSCTLVVEKAAVIEALKYPQ